MSAADDDGLLPVSCGSVSAKFDVKLYRTESAQGKLRVSSLSAFWLGRNGSLLLGWRIWVEREVQRTGSVLFCTIEPISLSSPLMGGVKLMTLRFRQLHTTQPLLWPHLQVFSALLVVHQAYCHMSYPCFC